MGAFTDLVRRLLDAGSVRLREPPILHPTEHEPVLDLLSTAFLDHRADVAGELIPFAPTISLRALELLSWSCWFLLHRGEPAEEVERRLPVLQPGKSASDHLSADLLFRFLPQVHRRARAVSPQDSLTRRLEDTLRHWPLSGVLAEIDEPPLVPVDLGGHPGLLLLYAERLAARLLDGQHTSRPAWMPQGLAGEYVALAFSERKLPLPSPDRSPT